MTEHFQVTRSQLINVNGGFTWALGASLLALGFFSAIMASYSSRVISCMNKDVSRNPEPCQDQQALYITYITDCSASFIRVQMHNATFFETHSAAKNVK